MFLPIKDSKVIGRYLTRLNELDIDNRIPVRESVYNKLKEVSEILDDNYTLVVAYGYRLLKK